MKKLFFCAALFLAGCVIPHPPLTTKEKNYFDELRSKCNCVIDREVNTESKKGEEHNPKDVLAVGRYTIALDSLPCETLLYKDSLKKISDTIARRLHRDILTDFQYTYENISVIFICQYRKNSTKSVSFDYTIPQLDSLCL